MSTVDPHRVVVTGENPFIRLSKADGEPNSTEASYWRNYFSPAGPGHVLFLKSEFTEGRWRVFSDNIAMTRWLQQTVQGMLNAELKDTSLPVTEATFAKHGDPRSFWTETVEALDDVVTLTWHDLGDPLLVHAAPNALPNRPYGVCTVLVPAASARLTLNGDQAAGRPWPRDREGRPFSTSALAFSESWTEAR